MEVRSVKVGMELGVGGVKRLDGAGGEGLKFFECW